MNIYQDELGWWIEPEGVIDEMVIPSLSGPWKNKTAAWLASEGKTGAAHDAEGRRET